ncbi:unnamed protein product [Psylliodes chrysocephalus]|uniref:Phorbol-ester/DAG-type domain-containing protein n=1 Tax=Psylliodes chrysocephalus TaxID=3402493 RepID=A0A9P0CQ13_9CUCU|nr:unnamed protein product [Psylliodes chrysocephala]
MYVIFPADEIVYLSYGHLIYVPSTPQPDNELRTPPIRTSLEENQPSFPSSTPRNSTVQFSQPETQKSSKLKEKSRPSKDWDKFDCIGSKSIDLESRGSTDRFKTNYFTPEPRTLEPTQLVSRSDLINRSGIAKNQEPSTSGHTNVPKGSKAQEPSTSGYKSGSSKNLEQGESRHTFDRYRTPNRSLKARNPVEPQQPDQFQIFCSANKPKQILKPTEPVSPNQQSFRLGTINKPPRSQKVESDTQNLINKSNKNVTETEFGSRNFEQDSGILKQTGSSNKSIRIKNKSESENTVLELELELESTSLNRLGSLSKTLRNKNHLEIENIGLKTPEPSDTGSLPRTKSRFLKSKEGGTFERAYNSNSTKSSKSSKNSSNSSKSSGPKTLEPKATGARQRTASDSVTTKIDKSKKRLSSDSFRSFLRSVSREKTPEPPLRPERRREKKILEDSYSEPLTPNRELVPRSDLINTRSDQVQDVKSAKPVIKREKSPVIRFFRAQSSSPRTLGRDKTAFDFDGLFKQDLRKLTVNSDSVGNKTRFGSDTNITNLGGKLSEKSPIKKRSFFRRKQSPSVHNEANMAGNESPLKDLIHPAYNEPLKSHNAVTFKLIRTVSDFTQQLGQMYEHHAEELQMLVANFRKRNGELRKERPACPSSLFHTWETLLQEVEIDSQALGDIASILGRQVSRPLLERSFHRKIQSRKVFTHRESYETIIAKTEEKLAKCRQEYKNAYVSYLSSPSTESLSAYFNTHNAYIQQLHATNGMMEEFGKNTLPSLLQELEEIYVDLCSTLTEAVLQGAEVVSNRSMEQCRRYESLVSQCRSVSGVSDLSHLARSLPVPSGRGPILRRIFIPPQPPPPTDVADGDLTDLPTTTDIVPPPLRDELVIDKLSAVQLKPSHDVLHKEAQDLEIQIRQIQDAVDTLLRIQQKSVEASLYNKANELQEDISMKRFDLTVAQIHLSALNAQKELFSNKLEGDSVNRERKMSGASTASMKNKWLKAFKSLKTPPPEAEKKNGAAATRELLKGDPDAHNFQEYTYKKITPCDVCSQVLRGHTRQGLKCRICKMNIHMDCQEKASKCQTKARLLRRQKSTSEIETRVPELNPDEERVAEVFSMPTINRRLSVRSSNHHSQVNPPLNNAVVLERNSQDGSGNRPFGQPLLLGLPSEKGNGFEFPPAPSSPTPSKGKTSPDPKSRLKNKNK